MAREEGSQEEKMWSSEMKLKSGSDHRVCTDPVSMEYGATGCSVRERLKPILDFTDNSGLPRWLKW